MAATPHLQPLKYDITLMNPSSLSALPLRIREQIDAQCCAFEEAWSSGQTPELKKYLAQVDDVGRQSAFDELIAI